MRAGTLRLENFVNHAESEVEFGPGVNVLVGGNEAGKSALVDGVRVSLVNKARGLAVADNRLLTRRGADGKCKVTLEVITQVEKEDVSTVLAWTPAGQDLTQETIREIVGVETNDAITAALDADQFMDMEPKDRKSLVFRASGGEISKALLEKYGVDDPAVVSAALTKSLKAAEAIAAEKKRTADRTATALEKPAPVDEQVQTAGGVKKLSTIDAAMAEAWLAKVRAARTALVAKIAKAEEAAAAAGRSAASRDQAQKDLDAAKRALSSVEAELAKRSKDATSPEKLRAEAATFDPAIAEPAPLEYVDIRTQPVPSMDLERRAVEDAERRLAAALKDPWTKVADLADRLEALPGKLGAVAAIATELRALTAENGQGDVTGLETALTAAVAARDKASAGVADVVEKNSAIEHSNRAARSMHAERVKDHKARVDIARKARQDCLERASLAERLAQGDAAKLESAKSSVRVAESRLSGIGEAAAGGAVEDLGKLREELGGLESRAAAGEVLVEKVHAYARGKAEHEDAKAKCAKLEADAARFEKMEKALRPDGVMGAVVAAPLAQLRKVLDVVAAKMLAKPVRITDGFEVVYDDAPASMASASTRWRIAAAIAVALSSLSGLRFVVLDEASINVGRTRDGVLLSLLAAKEYFDQAIVVVSRPETDEIKPPPAHLREALRIFRVVDGTVAPVLANESAGLLAD